MGHLALGLGLGLELGSGSGSGLGHLSHIHIISQSELLGGGFENGLLGLYISTERYIYFAVKAAGSEKRKRWI